MKASESSPDVYANFTMRQLINARLHTIRNFTFIPSYKSRQVDDLFKACLNEFCDNPDKIPTAFLDFAYHVGKVREAVLA